MRDENAQQASDIKSKQYRNLAMAVLIGIVILISLYSLVKSNNPAMPEVDKLDTSAFSSPVENVNGQSVWIERAQNQLKEQQRQTDELKQTITQMKNDTQTASEEDPKYQQLKEQNELLKKSLDEKSESVPAPMDGSNQYQGRVFSTTPGVAVSGTPPDLVASTESTGIDVDELDLKPATNLQPKKNPDTFVPSGTFAEAIMLGAADASAGVNTQANPSPMLFRVVANGTLPNHQKSHLKDCVVTAAVVGDISSERGQIRLERMSCTFPNGEIVEQSVEGTVFGMDAKNGVRGSPVWREGALLGRAAVAGTLSGIGSGISQSYTTNSISPLGTTQTVSGGDIFKYGAAQGASNAMEKLADYNIRRAELYHPIIQLTAGQRVDVVFLKGFYLDGRKHEESEQESAVQSDLFPITTNTPSTSVSGLTLSESEMQKIKQHEQSMGWVQSQQSGGMQ